MVLVLEIEEEMAKEGHLILEILMTNVQNRLAGIWVVYLLQQC
jgi:hypothetical protein